MNKAQQYADGVAPAFTRMGLRELSELSLYKNVVSFISALFGRKSIYYINGADSLPPPLDREVEDEYVILATAGDKKAKEELITHNLRLVVYIAKKFESTGIYIEDLISIGSIGLIKAVNTFQPDKNIKLATYASRCIENEILMYLRSVKKTDSAVSLDDPIGSDSDGNEIRIVDLLNSDEDVPRSAETTIESARALRLLDEILDRREKQVIVLRYGIADNIQRPQHETARIMGISRSYVSRIEKQALTKLRSAMDDCSDKLK